MDLTNILALQYPQQFESLWKNNFIEIFIMAIIVLKYKAITILGLYSDGYQLFDSFCSVQRIQT